MKNLPTINELWTTGKFYGENKPSVRITVQPDWYLNVTTGVYGNSIKGPFRWFQDADNGQTEVEIPNVKSAEIDKTLDQDAGTLSFSIFNTWMDDPEEPTSLEFGMPGYFWFEHGKTEDSETLWNQATNAWEDVIVPNALIRTYEGFGGHDLSIHNAQVAGNLVLTGVWIVDDVTGGTSGMLEVKCRDTGRLLTDQYVYPPLVPLSEYPLSYWPSGTHTLANTYGSWAPGYAEGETKCEISYLDSSSDQFYATFDHEVVGHKPSSSEDGDQSTFAISIGRAGPQTNLDYWAWVTDSAEAAFNRLYVFPWGGPYVGDIAIGGTTVITGVHFDKDVAKVIELPATYTGEVQIKVTLSSHQMTEWDTDAGPYRAGIREVRAYLTNQVTPDTVSVASFTLSIESHPAGGYWISDVAGTVYAYGAASTFSQSDSPYGTVDPYSVVAIATNPAGNGYWLLQNDGKVHSYGSCAYHGDNAGHAVANAIDLIPTYTGLGYWILHMDGTIANRGDAPAYANGDKTQLLLDREAKKIIQVDSGTITGGVGHPTDYGLWFTNGNGEVGARGSCLFYGQLENRLGLTPTEWIHGMETTPEGKGYWLAFGSGKVIFFGNAANLGGVSTAEELDQHDVETGFFFSKLVWDICANPDGTGFYVLQADGTVTARNAFFWGDPAHGRVYNVTSNYDDYSEIVKELLLWAGFLIHSDSIGSGDIPPVFGVIESTGIMSDVILDESNFDKKSIIDCIKTLREIVGYYTWIQDDGSFSFQSPNYWQPGNFVGGVWTSSRLTISETQTLRDYSVVVDAKGLRSEIIIASEDPDPHNPQTTTTTRYVPATAPNLRGMISQAIWPDETFAKSNERLLMAELIAMHIYLSQRNGSVTCVANPAVELNDQILVQEKNTSDSYCHFVRAVRRTFDAQSGSYEMSLTLNWLGTDDEWVITSDSVPEGTPRLQMSQALQDWVALGRTKTVASTTETGGP